MNYIFAENLTKHYGDKLLFEGISFRVDQGKKIALIARNGAGKTTLFKALMGEEPVDEGRIEFKKDLRIGFLKQEPDLLEVNNILQEVFFSDNPAIAAIRNYEMCLENPEDEEAMKEAIALMDSQQAWEYEVKVKLILSRLGITRLSQTIGTLSGGEKKRVALAKVLISDPDLLILDEPTNHLDLMMIEWLEDFLKTEKMTLLMVTHDRYFLDRVCDEILELYQGELHRFTGNYSSYLEKKAARDEIQKRTVERAQSLMRTELDWMRRMPKARGTKAKARVDSFYRLKETADQKIGEKQVSIEIKEERIGGKIVEFHAVKKAFGDLKILDSFDYKFQRYDRVGVVGKNGSGKSTFLNMLTGEEGIDGGKIVIGETLKIGYYRQDGMKIKEQKRIYEVVKDVAEFIPMPGGQKLYAAQLLERFLFPRKTHFNHVSTLSGGERRRLYLLTVLMDNPNFLILDEPTNDLDIMTLSVLEDFLGSFKGCLVIVSHDRFFMDKLVDHIFVFEGEGMTRDFPGNYTHYREWKRKEDKKKHAERQAKTESTKPKREKTRRSYQEQREFEQLEKDLEALEERKVELNQRLTEEITDHNKLIELTTELDKVVKSLDEKTDRWLELSEFDPN